MEVFRVVFPRHMDANEYAMKVQPAAKSLGTAVRAARWIAGSRPVAVPGELEHPPTATDAPDTDKQSEQPSATASEMLRAGPEVILPLAAQTAEEEAQPASNSAAEMPASAIPTSALEASEDEVMLSFGPRQWRVRGLLKNSSLAAIKVSVRVMLDAVFFQDVLDVLSARARAAFLRQAVDELGLEERVLKADLGKVILQLEALLESQLRQKLQPEKRGYQMTESEQAQAMHLLRDPKLLERVLSDFSRCGVVGEETNKLALYLAAVSRKLEAPLAVVIQSSSAAGKSSLMDAVLRFVPDEEQVSYSAMTGQSLFYMGATDLQHKVLAIAEERGAQNAAYALKLLQSSGELTIASTGKDPATGRLVTQEYRVQGPVMVMLTTTSIDVDEELLNRCMVLTVDEGRDQTRAIQRLQREARTLEGLVRKHARGGVMQLHQNAQRLLKPLHVVNPFAAELSFADHATRTRRDHAKYLGLIDAIALLHQHQRPVKTASVGGAELRYIEVTRQDMELAGKLATSVLARGLDELAPQTRRLLGLVTELVSERAQREGLERADVRFSRRDVREYTGWGQTQLKVHLGRLEELEHLLVHAGGARRRMVYELADYAYDGHWSGSGRPLVGSASRPDLSLDFEKKRELVGLNAEAHRGKPSNGGSYADVISPLVASPAAASPATEH
jgi:hypothetical protein